MWELLSNVQVTSILKIGPELFNAKMSPDYWVNYVKENGKTFDLYFT